MKVTRLRIRMSAGVFVTIAAMLAAMAGGIAVTAAPAGASGPTTVVVGNGDIAPNGPWALEPSSNTGTYGFVSGPAPAPGGVGSLAMSIASGQHEWLNNYSYGACATGNSCSVPLTSWTPLANIDALSFSTYRASGTTYPTLNIEADWAGTGSSYTTFVFIPTAANIVNSTWQSWDGLNVGDGTWYSTTNTGVPPFNCSFQAAGCNASWTQIQAAYPTARVRFGLGLNVGTGGTFAGNLDNLNVGVSGTTTVYDFEPDCTTTCYVDATNGNDLNTGQAGDPLATVQAGVNKVSSGGTVNVAAGTYTEQLVVNKPVSIIGAGAATTTIEGPTNLADSSCVAGGTRAEVSICGSANSSVTMSNLTVSGGATGEDADASCGPQITGIYVSDGETLNIDHSTVTNVFNAAGSSFWGCQQGIGIRAGSNALGIVGHLVADHATVLRYQKGGIVIDGPGSTGTITNSTVSGDQLAGLSAAIAMNGIQISRGASASVSGNTVSGNECDLAGCGSDPVTQDQAAGIVLYDQIAGQSPVPTISIANNSVTGNDLGVYSGQLTGTPVISGNTVNANRYVGIELDEGTADLTGNTITNNPSVGVFAVQGFSEFAGQGSLGDTTATLTGNTINGNATGIKAVDTTADAFTTHLTVNRNGITSNPTNGVNNTAASSMNATCNWWGQSSGPAAGEVAGTVTTTPFLGSSNLAGPCPAHTAPGVPRAVFGVPYNDHGAKVVWTAPASNGGSPITGYRITPFKAGVAQPAVILNSTATHILIAGLTDKVSYRFTVAARNAVGFGTASTQSPAMIAGAPGQPGVPTAVKVASGSLKVTFAAPMNDGAAITSYSVTCSSTNGGVAKTKTGTASPITVTGLSAGKSYGCRVKATNSRGTGPNSDPSPPVNA
jgi:parallel beta-helix repeat protein